MEQGNTLQAANLLRGSNKEISTLKSRDIFDSILPKVGAMMFNPEEGTNGDNVNDEILSSQKDYFDREEVKKAKSLDAKNLLKTTTSEEKEPTPFANTLDVTEEADIGNKKTMQAGAISAQVTRYGFEGDAYQSHRATSKGSKYENIGNRSNTLEEGVSIALPPATAKKLGVNLKGGEYVEAYLGDTWQKFRVDDTAAKHKNDRIDFFDPKGIRKKIDGSQVQIRKFSRNNK